MTGYRLKVAIVQRIFPHYREGIFDSLFNEYDLKLFHGKDDSNIPQIERIYSVFCKLANFMGFKYLFNTFSMIKFKPDAIVHEFSVSIVNLYLLFFYCKLTGAKFYLWGHGYDQKKGFNPKGNLADRIRSFFIRKSDAVILYSDDVKKQLVSIYPDVSFFVARNSIQTKERDSKYYSMKGVRPRLRGEVGFNHDAIHLCFVSRLGVVKKPHLLNEFVSLSKDIGANVIIHVIGDGSELAKLKQLVWDSRNEDSFEFYGALYDEDMVSRLIFCSDFLLMPSWLGLSVNHSFCYGTPVATLSSEKHPPEIQFAVKNLNAVIEEDLGELAKAVIEISSDSHCYSQYRENSRAYFERELGMNEMKRGFLEAVGRGDIT